MDGEPRASLEVSEGKGDGSANDSDMDGANEGAVDDGSDIKLVVKASKG